MPGIAGTTTTDHSPAVASALDAMRHRGPDGSRIVREHGATLGQVWSTAHAHCHRRGEQTAAVLDGEVWNWAELRPGATSPLEALAAGYAEAGPSFVSRLQGHFALAVAGADGLLLGRDPLGVVPLYYHADETLSFASEAEAMCALSADFGECPPGHYYHPRTGLVRHAKVAPGLPLIESPEQIARELRHRLVRAVARRVAGESTGAWLSGGLDSSAIAALAVEQKGRLKTFVAGVEGAPDLPYAHLAATFLGTEHHERICTPRELVAAVPEVVRHLESFDALLVRSSLTNYLAGQMAADQVSTVLSGEGGDELFAGYDYLTALPPGKLADELLAITKRLHNTALQRVGRCSRAHGLVAHVPFLDDEVVALALRIPTRYKLDPSAGRQAKWILRRAMDGRLPPEIVSRPKAKFWEGAGVQGILKEHAERVISDSDFRAERTLPDGTEAASKEELLYYRAFREHLGEDVSISFVGRTPVAA